MDQIETRMQPRREVIEMKRCALHLVAVALAGLVVAPATWATFNLFDRAEPMDYVEHTCRPLEAFLAPGDDLDYAHAAFCSGSGVR